MLTHSIRLANSDIDLSAETIYFTRLFHALTASLTNQASQGSFLDPFLLLVTITLAGHFVQKALTILFESVKTSPESHELCQVLS